MHLPAFAFLFSSVAAVYAATSTASPPASVVSNNVPPAWRETEPRVLKVLVVNYDPILRSHGGVRLSRYLKWNDPRPMTTNLLRYIREVSGGSAELRLVEFLDVDAFPKKRSGFRCDEESFPAMWKDMKKVHQPDGVSYRAIFEELNLVAGCGARVSAASGFGPRPTSARTNTR